MNTSVVDDDSTARTDADVAWKRASVLHVLGVKSVLELCVGPSLRTLEEAYARYNIEVTGNDIDPRWQRYHPQGRWLIGDALSTGDWSAYGAVVFAPPLSRGCTGRRDDALQIDQVFPRYDDFLSAMDRSGYRGVGVLVLPARAMATRQDRGQLHALLSRAHRFDRTLHVMPMTSGRRNIRKYVDVYLVDEAPSGQATQISAVDRP